jgi:succinate dehydrogenase / fumarate reductase cytochrome b subunit
MTKANRPLSPHLQVYRWGAHMAVSILHRATGSALAVGAILLTWWLVAMATGYEYFGTVQEYAGSWIGRLVLLGITFSLMQHLASGVRHLFMDMGKIYDLKINTLSAKATFVFSVLATLGVWFAASKVMGISVLKLILGEF